MVFTVTENGYRSEDGVYVTSEDCHKD